MSNVRYVGLDVHKDSISIAVADPGREPAEHVGTVSGDWHALHKHLKKLTRNGDTLHICYEAGPCGFQLQRRLVEAGYETQVVAPSLIPQKAGQRIKTDRRDARKLAACLRAGELTAVWIPDEATEAIRDLERARDAAKNAERTARHQLGKFLLRHGRRWTQGSTWTQKHLAWIRKQTFAQEPLNRVLADYLQTVEDATARVQRLTADLEELVHQTALAPLVTALQALRGVSTISSTVIAAEIGDLKRFDTAKQFMAFVGLVPSEHSSGPRTRRGRITRTGNKHVRRILLEAAWHYSRPGLKISRELRRRQDAASPEVRQIARKAQQRLARKYRHLAYERRLPPTRAITAVARELAGFVWAIGQEPRLVAS